MRKLFVFLGLWLAVCVGVQPVMAAPIGAARAAVLSGGVCGPGIASADFTKANGQALTCLITKGAATFTRSSVKTCGRLDGTLIQALANTPCVTDQGWLVEAAATNLVFNSTISGCCSAIFGTVTPTTGQSDPLGGAAATQLSGSGNWQYGANAAISANTTYTCSYYVRASTPTAAAVIAFDGTTNTSQSITVTPSWQRVSATVTSGASATNLRCAIGSGSGSVTITIAFPQAQTGTVPTSWCPTSAGSATCAADALSITFPGTKASATVTYGAGSTVSPSATSPINLGASGGGAWVGSYVKKLVVK